MKDQYFGDFGDYQKISLLKELQKEDLTVLLHWMKTRDDGSGDGKHVSYLSDPEKWRLYDADIYDSLKEGMATGRRTLQHIENGKYSSGVQFLSEYIEDDSIRSSLLTKIIKSKQDVVLFDPDNGIEVLSTNRNNKHKYVTWLEIRTAYESGKSVIIYQHYPRANRVTYIQSRLAEIKERISCKPFAIQVRHSTYLIMSQTKHDRRLRNVAENLSHIWGNLAVLH